MASTPTNRKSRLGRLLSELRDRAGRSAEEAARLLRVTAATISRYESGHVRPGYPALQALLAYYSADEETKVHAESLWEDAGERATRVRLPGTASKEYRAFVRAEAEASTVRVLQPITVHGMLQTAAYAEGVMESTRRFRDPDVRVTRYVAARISRQKRLAEENPLIYHAILDEAAVRRQVGSPAVMIEQLQHLLTVSERPNVTVQIVPFEAGAYSTMSGSCIILGFAREDDPTTVYLEHPAGGEWIDNETDVKRFEDMFGDVATEAAWSPDKSAEFIRSQIRTLESR